MKREGGEQRAKCPCFLARTDYKRGRYIQCSGKFWRFKNAELRDAHYKGYCCESYTECIIYRERRIQHGSAGNR